VAKTMNPHHTAPVAVNPRHASTLRRHTVLRVIALGVAALLLFVGTGVATAYFRFNGNLKSADVTSLLGERPTQAPAPPGDPSAGLPQNILLLGSDTRSGDNAAIGGANGGMRSDTSIIMHISADRSRVELISIPRDSWVKIPSCLRSDGTKSAPATTKFNAAFAYGAQSGSVTDAAACTIKTVESLTHVLINDFVVVDFTGVVDMVNALGGVPMCIPNNMSSPDSGLNVKAGFQTLDGKTAIAFARARKGPGLGDGSDTGRITRQQDLLGATLRQAQSKNLLTDAGALYKFLNAATSSLTMSPGLASIPKLVGLAYSLRGLQAKDVTFVTVPWRPLPADPNNVEWLPAADTIWANLNADRPVNQVPGKAGATTAPTTGAGTTATPGSTPAGTPSPVTTAGTTAALNPASVCG
jgi:LCP family protein required for cell wall assembly